MQPVFALLQSSHYAGLCWDSPGTAVIPSADTAAVLQELWPQLQSDLWAAEIVVLMGDRVSEGCQEQADSRAAIVHLQGHVMNLACDDIGRAMGVHVLLPMMCQRLEAKFGETIHQQEAAVHQAVRNLC